MVQKVLKIPNNIDGTPVVIVKANAFAGSMVDTLYLGENIAVLDAGAFGGAASLKSVYVPYSKNDPGMVSVPNSMDPAGLATMGANDCITQSREMMNGYKWKLFCLDFSFIGWYLLGALCLGVGTIFVVPYHQMARTNFYLALKSER